MEYIKQNASGLYIDIQKIGCFFRSALHMAEMEAHKALTESEINKLWDFAKRCKYINAENNVITSAPIANLAAEKLGLKGRFIEVAVFKDGQMNWYSSIPNSQRRVDYWIKKIKQNGPSKTHFLNVNKYGQEEWDPHEPAINEIGVYYTICYIYEERK